MEYLSKFEIEKFRCFNDKQTLNFAIPNGESGSGITYIVGKNNCGKTSLLEALRLSESNGLQNSTLRTSDIIDNSVRFATYIRDEDDDVLIQELKLVRDDSCSLENISDKDRYNSFRIKSNPIFIPSRRYWDVQVNNQVGIENAKSNLINDSELMRYSANRYVGSHIADAFHAIEMDDEKYNACLELIKAVFPDFNSFTMTKEDLATISYTMNDGSKHRADFLGDGVVSVMRVMVTVLLYEDRPIIIDEPELSLHPAAQKRLIKVIAERAKKQQIILATHSAYMVCWDYLSNGASLNHLVKHKKETNIYVLNNVKKYKALLSSNWSHPFVADVVSKEIFFSDNILFVEGQEDVGLLQKDGVLDDNINVFGYGVDGCGNFDFALTLANDMGIMKAGVLIDGGENEREIALKLSKKYENYLIVQWERDDIRDKDCTCSLDENGSVINGTVRKGKIGYFDKEGNKKEDIGDYNVVIAKINNYFCG